MFRAFSFFPHIFDSPGVGEITKLKLYPNFTDDEIEAESALVIMHKGTVEEKKEMELHPSFENPKSTVLSSLPPLERQGEMLVTLGRKPDWKTKRKNGW